jgi:hypothetical protein
METVASNTEAKLIRLMTRRKALQWWKIKVRTSEVTCQSLVPVGKLLMKRDRPNASTTVQDPLRIKYYSNGKADAFDDCLDNHEQ